MARWEKKKKEAPEKKEKKSAIKKVAEKIEDSIRGTVDTTGDDTELNHVPQVG